MEKNEIPSNNKEQTTDTSDNMDVCQNDYAK